MKKPNAICLLLVFCLLQPGPAPAGSNESNEDLLMIDIQRTRERLKTHLRALTVAIGERSVRFPRHLAAAADYITSFYQDLGAAVHSAPYSYRNIEVANVVAEMSTGPSPSRRYIVGAHYDTVAGTVGADDNASAIAVQLETARNLRLLLNHKPIDLDVGVTFVSFALEEPPVYGTSAMGSRVYAGKARRNGEKIDGMICLEMVGYACCEPGCQSYPFPLGLFGYPEDGSFIGIVGNTRSGSFTRELVTAFRKNPDLPVVKFQFF